MSDKFVLTGTVCDGEYDLDLEEHPLTMGELHLIKKISGVRAGELEEALNAGDTDVIGALAIVSVKRGGRELPEEALWSLPPGALVFVAGDADAGPPDETPGKNNSETGTSGLSSETSSDANQETTPISTGTPS